MFGDLNGTKLSLVKRNDPSLSFFSPLFSLFLFPSFIPILHRGF